MQYSHLPPPPTQPYEGKHAPLKFLHFLSFALFAGQGSYVLILTSFERLLTFCLNFSVLSLQKLTTRHLSPREWESTSNSDNSLIEFNHFDLSLFQCVILTNCSQTLLKYYAPTPSHKRKSGTRQKQQYMPLPGWWILQANELMSENDEWPWHMVQWNWTTRLSYIVSISVVKAGVGGGYFLKFWIGVCREGS